MVTVVITRASLSDMIIFFTQSHMASMASSSAGLKYMLKVRLPSAVMFCQSAPASSSQSAPAYGVKITRCNNIVDIRTGRRRKMQVNRAKSMWRRGKQCGPRRWRKGGGIVNRGRNGSDADGKNACVGSHVQVRDKLPETAGVSGDRRTKW